MSAAVPALKEAAAVPGERNRPALLTTVSRAGTFTYHRLPPRFTIYATYGSVAVTQMGGMMRHLNVVPVKDSSPMQQRDFVTLEDERPAEISITPAGALEHTTSFTDVKHETTDDN